MQLCQAGRGRCFPHLLQGDSANTNALINLSGRRATNLTHPPWGPRSKASASTCSLGPRAPQPLSRVTWKGSHHPDSPIERAAQSGTDASLQVMAALGAWKLSTYFYCLPPAACPSQPGKPQTAGGFPRACQPCQLGTLPTRLQGHYRSHNLPWLPPTMPSETTSTC